MCALVSLCLNLHPVLGGEHQPPIVVGCGFLCHRQPESVVKLRDTNLPLMQGKHKSADDVGLGLPLFFLLLEGIHPGLGLFVPRNIRWIFAEVVFMDKSLLYAAYAIFRIATSIPPVVPTKSALS